MSEAKDCGICEADECEAPFGHDAETPAEKEKRQLRNMRKAARKVPFVARPEKLHTLHARTPPAPAPGELKAAIREANKVLVEAYFRGDVPGQHNKGRGPLVRVSRPPYFVPPTEAREMARRVRQRQAIQARDWHGLGEYQAGGAL